MKTRQLTDFERTENARYEAKALNRILADVQDRPTITVTFKLSTTLDLEDAAALLDAADEDCNLPLPGKELRDLSEMIHADAGEMRLSAAWSGRLFRVAEKLRGDDPHGTRKGKQNLALAGRIEAMARVIDEARADSFRRIGEATK